MTTTTDLFVQDVTLRDGMHAVRHRIDPTDVGRIVAAAENISWARLTTLLLPGIGTPEELKHAYSLGVRSDSGPLRNSSSSTSEWNPRKPQAPTRRHQHGLRALPRLDRVG